MCEDKRAHKGKHGVCTVIISIMYITGKQVRSVVKWCGLKGWLMELEQ